MPKTVEVTLYTFEELSDKAKEKAREWWRECEAQDFGGFGELYEPAETAAKLLGIEFAKRAVPLMGGGTRYDPEIWWTLHVQGAGASFAGSYRYAKDSARKIAAEFGTDAELLRIARELAEIQKKYRYQLTAKITANGRETHSSVMEVGAYNANGDQIGFGDEQALLGLVRDFADWIYEGINAQWEDRMSDEQVDESIRANEHTFLADGTRRDD
jgi:hypothetical protein